MTLLYEAPPVAGLDLTEPVHFIGIGGAGMSGLARVVLARGGAVTGSDVRESETTRALRAEGAQVLIGHAAENVGRPGRVIYSAAINESNPELAAARQQGIPTQSRAALLGDLMRGTVGIAVAGTHGKTTTTGMIATMLHRRERDPDGAGRWGPAGDRRQCAGQRRPLFRGGGVRGVPVVPGAGAADRRGDEHRGGPPRLLWLAGGRGRGAFEQFLDRLDPEGAAVLCWDDARIRRLRPHPAERTWLMAWKAAGRPAGDRAPARRALELASPEPSFTVEWRGEPLGRITLGVPGKHNVQNALAAVAVGLEVGLSFEEIQRGLGEFRGTGRRFELLGEPRGIRVIDDYAHHPTEIAANLGAVKQALRRPMIAVFQPHLYSRTQLLMDDFARSFADADRVVITEIYPAREAPIPGVSGAHLVEAIRRHLPGKDARFLASKEEVVNWLAGTVPTGRMSSSRLGRRATSAMPAKNWCSMLGE